MSKRILIGLLLASVLMINAGCGLALSYYGCHKYVDPVHGCDKADEAKRP